MVALILGYGDLTVYLVMGEGALNILHDRRGFRGEVKVVWGLYTIEHLFQLQSAGKFNTRCIAV